MYVDINFKKYFVFLHFWYCCSNSFLKNLLFFNFIFWLQCLCICCLLYSIFHLLYMCQFLVPYCHSFSKHESIFIFLLKFDKFITILITDIKDSNFFMRLIYFYINFIRENKNIFIDQSIKCSVNKYKTFFLFASVKWDFLGAISQDILTFLNKFSI